ncbi:unnamed protein product, partial [Heterosigma akashiwo]
MGDDGGLTSFFFYVCFVYPVTSWILKPGRFARQKAIYYAIGFLCAIAAVKTGMEYMERGPNHYAVLGVTRQANPLEIKRAYKTASLEHHPDKGGDEDAFNRVKTAYDVLMDMELREVYNKFGQEGVDSNKRFDEYQLLLEIAIFYATWGMLAYVLTLGKQSQNARTWIYTGEIICLVAEVSLMVQQGSDLPSWFFPRHTEAELVWLLRALFPAWMNGCRCMGGFLFVDLDAQQRKMLLALQEQNKDVLMISIQGLQGAGGGRGAMALAAAAAAGPGGAGGAAPSTAGQAPVVRATATGKLRELEERLARNKALGLDPAKVAAEIKGGGQKKQQVSTFWWMLGL